MKSIKRKAEENCIKYGNLGNVAYTEFIAGANYVLDAIEDVLTNPRRYVNPDKSVEEGMIDALIKRVEELKSNQ